MSDSARPREKLRNGVSSPCAFPAQTAVATLVLYSTIHVWVSSCEPVLPSTATPSRGLAWLPVPPFMTPCRAYAAVAATPGVSAWVHERSGFGSSLPSASVPRSLICGSQYLPPLATVAKAPAIAKGETASCPMTCAGPLVALGTEVDLSESG